MSQTYDKNFSSSNPDISDTALLSNTEVTHNTTSVGTSRCAHVANVGGKINNGCSTSRDTVMDKLGPVFRTATHVSSAKARALKYLVVLWLPVRI